MIGTITRQTSGVELRSYSVGQNGPFIFPSRRLVIPFGDLRARCHGACAAPPPRLCAQGRRAHQLSGGSSPWSKGGPDPSLPHGSRALHQRRPAPRPDSPDRGGGIIADGRVSHKPPRSLEFSLRGLIGLAIRNVRNPTIAVTRHGVPAPTRLVAIRRRRHRPDPRRRRIRRRSRPNPPQAARHLTTPRRLRLS